MKIVFQTSVQVFIQFASKQTEDDETKSKDDSDKNDKEGISNASLKPVSKPADIPIEDAIAIFNEEHSSPNRTEDSHLEFVNPLIFADSNGSEITDASLSKSFLEGHVELVEVNRQGRNTTIVDATAVEV